MPLKLSRCWCPGWLPGAHARKESNPRPAVLETAAPPWLERKRDDAHDVVRGMPEGAAVQAERPELPAHAGTAGIGRFPTPRPLLMIERLAGWARVRAEAPQGFAPELRPGGKDACHRNTDGEPSRPRCQRDFLQPPARRSETLTAAECIGNVGAVAGLVGKRSGLKAEGESVAANERVRGLATHRPRPETRLGPCTSNSGSGVVSALVRRGSPFAAGGWAVRANSQVPGEGRPADWSPRLRFSTHRCEHRENTDRRFMFSRADPARRSKTGNGLWPARTARSGRFERPTF
jgi:hypothetical protein